MHPSPERGEKALLIFVGALAVVQSAVDAGKPPERRQFLEAPIQEAEDVCSVLEVRGGPEALVDAREREHAIDVGLEAPLLAELLQHDARSLEVARQLGDPGVREDRELVHLAIRALVLGRDPLAPHARFVRPPGQEVTEGLFELELRRRLSCDPGSARVPPTRSPRSGSFASCRIDPSRMSACSIWGDCAWICAQHAMA
jgi:hypothetical protein